MRDFVDPEEVHPRLVAGDPLLVLLDCRAWEELQIAQVRGAVHIPMGEIADRLDEIPRDKEIIVMCHHGVRSAAVARFLRAQGYARVMNLNGGIDAWAEVIDPKLPRY